MKNLKEKLKFIYLPFLLITIIFVVLYSFLNWILFIKTDFIQLKDDIVKFWIPFALPWIPILIWLKPRIKLLRFKNDNTLFAFQFLASLAIAFPTIVAQKYLDTSTGKLTKLENIVQFDSTAKTKYYSLKTYFIDKANAGILNTATISGKHNENLNLLIYATIPIFAASSDTIKAECSYWLGKKYSKQISNKLSDDQKESKFQEFAKKSQNEFDSTKFEEFVYLERIGNTDDHDEYTKAVIKSELVHYKDPVIFNSVNDSFENRNGDSLAWIFKAFGIGWLVFFIFLLFPALEESETTKFKKGIKVKDTDLKEMLELLIPKQGYFATPILIDLNILIYLIMVFSGLGFISFTGYDLLNWGANYKPSIMKGEWWRLLTNIFLHGGLMHIVANMFGLLFVGIFLEPLLGRLKYIIIYLSTGILASCASIWWYPSTVSIGASGAIFGLYGLFLALLLLKVFPKDFSKSFLVSTVIFIGYNLLMGLAGGIDNAAHIGGLLSGFLIGLILGPSLKDQTTSLI